MYNFDEIINRQNTNALNTDGFRSYIFHADENMTFPYKDEDFIRMWVADMEFATPDVVINGIKKRLDDRIFGYTSVFEDSYYQSFNNWCKTRYNWTFPKEELVTSNGIIPALYALVDYICKDDEKVLFSTPSYAYFKYAAEASNKESVCSDLINDNGHYTIDFDDLEAKASDPKTKIFIFCNPHNPTGRVWTEDELSKIAEIMIKHDVWVISDEIHCDLIRCNQTHIPMGKIMLDYSKLITCMAPSKTFNMAGLRMSNIIIRDKELRDLWKAKYYNSDNPLSIAATQSAYEEGMPWLEELRVYLDENFRFTKEYLNTHLPKAGFNISQATYLAWVDLSEYFDKEDNLSMFFAYEAGVLLEGGNMFVQNSDCFIRLNLSCPKSVLSEGLKRICDAVNNKNNK